MADLIDILQKVKAAQAQREMRSPGAIHPSLHVIATSEDGYAATFGALRFIVSETKESDGHWWRHASVSRTDKQLPRYEDLKTLKRLTIGDRLAIQLFPASDKHIDLAGPMGTEVLHLWACMDGEVLPDFSSGTGSI